MLSTEQLVVLSNVGVFVVTAALVGLGAKDFLRESHRHEEAQTKQVAFDERELIKIVHEVVVEERRLEQVEPGKVVKIVPKVKEA
jgi:hypothetical protein